MHQNLRRFKFSKMRWWYKLKALFNRKKTQRYYAFFNGDDDDYKNIY